MASTEPTTIHTIYTRNHGVNLLRCCSCCRLKSNKFPHPPNQIFIVGVLCGIVIFRPPCSSRWLVVECCRKSSLARSAVLARSSSDARPLSLPAAVRPSPPSSSTATTPSPLPSMVGCSCLLLCHPSTHSCCPRGEIGGIPEREGSNRCPAGLTDAGVNP